MGYCFDQDKTTSRLFAIPMSKTKQLGKPGVGSVPWGGFRDYYRRVLEPRISGKTYKRIVLVDHSGSGRSVDGAKTALLNILRAGDTTVYNQLTGPNPGITWGLINVIDYRRRLGGARPYVPPKQVPLLAAFTAGVKARWIGF